jgi:hypothetical protein
VNVLKQFFTRLSNWCFGETEESAIGAVPPREPQPATLKFPTPENIGAAMQKAIAEATGVPIENVKIIPMKLMPCDCARCQAARKFRGAYQPSAN